MQKTLSLMLVLALFFAAGLSAQSTMGKVSGKVTDTAKVPLPGVTVKLTGKENRLVLTRISDESGTFRLDGVPAGRYDVSVELRGFQPLRLLDVVVKADETLEIPAISLRVAGSGGGNGYPLPPPEAVSPGAAPMVP